MRCYILFEDFGFTSATIGNLKFMKNIITSLLLYGLALVLYNQLLNENYDSGNSSYPAASWNYKEKLAGYTDRDRPYRQALFSDDSNRDLFRE